MGYSDNTETVEVERNKLLVMYRWAYFDSALDIAPDNVVEAYNHIESVLSETEE